MFERIEELIYYSHALNITPEQYLLESKPWKQKAKDSMEYSILLDWECRWARGLKLGDEYMQARPLKVIAHHFRKERL